MPPVDKSKKRSRWYFGGVASALAVTVTHPIDLVKVLLQTEKGNVPITHTMSKLYKEKGVLGFYNGLSASVLRQLTYSTTRFAIYGAGKPYINSGSLMGQIVLATIAGTFGGVVGVPADVINVRMQNDVKLPAEKRRNYNHVFDGLIKVYRDEGVSRLFAGTVTATTRGVMMTIGQLVSYDQIKEILLSTSFFEDTLRTHFVTSILAGVIATTLTQPLDVLKTRTMNAKPGEYANMWAVVKDTAADGPLGFYKGYVPAFIRIAPQTVILFLLLEQLRMNFGIPPPASKE